MIYRKDANFPYPVLSNTSHSYAENFFELDINVNENIDNYHFHISYEIDSEFMKYLLKSGKAVTVK